MAGFPLTDPDRFPVPLDELLARLGERGKLAHLSIAATSSGEWQASCKGPEGNGYSVAIDDDMIRAILKAVGPDYGKTWPSLLGEDYEEVFDVEDEEDLEDVL